MSTTRTCFIICALAVVITAACGGGNPAGPEGPPGVTAGLKLVAPRDVAPGDRVQLVSNVVKADGSVVNVSARAEWTVRSATGSSVLSVNPTGLVTGGDRGEGVVTARFEGRADEATILVLPKHTFRLTGTISDGAVGLANVTVAVVSGVGEGLSASTDARGNYALYGVAGRIELRATKEGYLDRTLPVDATWDRSYSFDMQSSRPTRDHSATYTLTVTTESTGPYCPAGTPQDLRRREYTATVEQIGADLKVSLTGADFVIASDGSGNSFRGGVSATGEITFSIRPATIWDYDAEDVRERLSDGTSICVAGTIYASSTPTGISGTASNSHGGTIYRCSGSSYVGDGGCWIERFEMVRR